MDNPKTSKLKLLKKTKSFLIGVSTIVILFGILFFGHSIIYAQKVLPHTFVGGLELGGLSKKAATKQLIGVLNSITSIKFQNQDKEWDFKISDIGIIFDPESSIEESYALGKSGGIGQRLRDQFISLFGSQKYPVHFVIDEKKFLETFDKLVAADIEDSELETSLVVENGQPKIIPGKDGQRIDRANLMKKTKNFLKFPTPNNQLEIVLTKSEPLVTAERAQKAKNEATLIVANALKLKTTDKEFNVETNLLSAWITGEVIPETAESSASKKIYTLMAVVSEDKVNAYVKALAGEINKDPANARISMVDGAIKILEGSVTGLTLQEKETTTEIIKKLEARKLGDQNHEVALVVQVTDPEINSDMIDTLGIKELIGKAATDYSTSPENRKHNISVGANFLSGIIVKNGEEFSALKYLGNVDASQGYLPELVIQDNKLENQYGGGLCQNATTLFRAIMDAGLPVTTRQNHSRRVAYYEKAMNIAGVNLTFDKNFANIGSALVGYDATVFVPQPDLKFTNDTGNAVLVQEYTSGNTVYAEIYGTRDSRKPSVSKAEILDTKPLPETIYHAAPNIPKGTNKIVTKGAAGAKTKFNYTITYSDGKQVSQDFLSHYRPIPPEIQVGSQEVIPPPTTQ